jgi:hypothetical protein
MGVGVQDMMRNAGNALRDGIMMEDFMLHSADMMSGVEDKGIEEAGRRC